jgi:site-specific DNA recombinase
VDGYSLDAQRETMRKYANFQNMEIVREYSDEGHSGKNIRGRQEFVRMLNDIEDGKDEVSFVLVFKLSRFGRNAADVLSSLQLMQDYGVNLICVEDNIDSSKEAGKLLISIICEALQITPEELLVGKQDNEKPEYDHSIITDDIEMQIMKECHDLSEAKKKRLLAYVSMLQNTKE